MSDTGEIFFLPHIMSAFQKIAPDTELYVIETDVAKLEEWLNAGKIDAVLCNRNAVPVDSAGEIIFTERYVCLASRRHPRLLNASLTVQQYLAERHAVVSPESGHHLVEEWLRELGCACRISAYCRKSSRKRSPGDDPVAYGAHVREIDVMLRWHEHSGDIIAQCWLCQTPRKCPASL
jgi:DNA-binding transcriptional LysR family regulator